MGIVPPVGLFAGSFCADRKTKVGLGKSIPGPPVEKLMEIYRVTLHGSEHALDHPAQREVIVDRESPQVEKCVVIGAEAEAVPIQIWSVVRFG